MYERGVIVAGGMIEMIGASQGSFTVIVNDSVGLDYVVISGYTDSVTA